MTVSNSLLDNSFFQFGMLIEFLFEQFPNWEDVGNQAIEDLQVSATMPIVD
jgi:hypothetical protein